MRQVAYNNAFQQTQAGDVFARERVVSARSGPLNLDVMSHLEMSVVDFISVNAAVLVSIVALVVSLRASYTSHRAYVLNLKNKHDADRIKIYEKKREVLSELDVQHTRFATLMMLTAQKILVFRDHPGLVMSMEKELERLRHNLDYLQKQHETYEDQRRGLEEIGEGADIAKQEELIALIRKLTIHVEKDIEHERADLRQLKERAREMRT